MITVSEFTLTLGIVSVKFKVDELNQTLESILSEMRSITSTLRIDEREVLQRIMNNRDKSLTVNDIYPNFKRDTEEHKTLRRLRDAQFIRPSEGDGWESHKHVEVKAFGRLMWEKVGEDKLFS